MNENDVNQAAEQVVKRGRPKGSGGNSRPDSTAQTLPGDNRKYILHSLKLADLDKISMQDPEAVRVRIKEYFVICANDDMKPSVAGLALSLGIDRRRLWEIREGKKGESREVMDALKKAMTILDLQMVDYMQNGKINPVSGIFLMKNNFGYADKQEVVVTPAAPLGEAADIKELEDRYADSVVIDVPYEGDTDGEN